MAIMNACLNAAFEARSMICFFSINPMKKVLVTGGACFIGSAVVRQSSLKRMAPSSTLISPPAAGNFEAQSCWKLTRSRTRFVSWK